MAKLEPDVPRRAARRTAPPHDVVDWLWATNEKSADYSFNKSHAACYALISYRTAWLKANYAGRVHGRADLLRHGHQGQGPVLRRALRGAWASRSCRPTSTSPTTSSSSSTGNIRFGLDAVKGVGYAAVEAIKRAREEGGPFTIALGLLRARRPAAVNKRSIEALIKCGAFAPPALRARACSRCWSRPRPPARRPSWTPRSARVDLRSRWSGRSRLRRRRGVRGAVTPADPDGGVRAERAAGPREGVDRAVPVGAPAQGGPRGAAGEGRHAAEPSSPSARTASGSPSAGSSPAARKMQTRTGDQMMFATLDDLEGSVEALFFGDRLAEYEHVARGRPDRHGPRPVDNGDRGLRSRSRTSSSFEPTRGGGRGGARAYAVGSPTGPEPLRVPARRARSCRASIIDDLKHVLGNHPGESDVVLHLETSGGPRRPALRRRATASSRRRRCGPSWTASSATRSLRKTVEPVDEPAAAGTGGRRGRNRVAAQRLARDLPAAGSPGKMRGWRVSRCVLAGTRYARREARPSRWTRRSCLLGYRDVASGCCTTGSDIPTPDSSFRRSVAGVRPFFIDAAVSSRHRRPASTACRSAARLRGRACAVSRRARAPLRSGRCWFGPGRLQHAREAVEARLGEEHRAAVLAELALADVRRGGRGWSPAPLWESLRCSEPRRSRPTTSRRTRRATAVRPSAVRMS